MRQCDLLALDLPCSFKWCALKLVEQKKFLELNRMDEMSFIIKRFSEKFVFLARVVVCFFWF